LKNFTDSDISFMRHALRLAKRGINSASPNPMVGAVIVKNGVAIAEGFHEKPGMPHAEAAALTAAGKRAMGAALYVNLEPCCHIDKKTPPCSRAIISSGIKEVFISMIDPNPKVAGRGISELIENGIKVQTGLLENEAKKLNEAYSKYITTGMPFVTLKVAMTLDGRIADANGRSKWITGEKSRRLVHRIRSRTDAILSGVGTVLADNPCFTARIKNGKNPKRIIVDPGFRTPLTFNVCNPDAETVFVVRHSAVQSEKVKKAIEYGLSVIEFESEVLDIKWLLQKLGDSGIASVMIEAGSRLNTHALSQSVVDKFLMFVAPSIIADSNAIPAFGSGVFRSIDEAFRLRDIRLKRVGQDVMMEAYPDLKPEF
jgi:diaminohydroxyphosphoribosylaminopyrimidine deaminase/5-amino-6-(5-phosphoribosylamino)uracil reductase